MDTPNSMITMPSMQVNKWNERHLHIEKDSNVDFSAVRATQVRCVIKVLQDSIYCVISALMLPKLLANPNHVTEVLAANKHEPAIRLIEDYVRRRDIIVKEQRPPLSDHGMIRIIDYFQRHPHVYKLFPEFRMSPEDRKLLFTFEQLFKIAKHHLLRSAKKELSSERKLHKIYKENEDIKKNIDDLRKKLAGQKVQLRWKLAAKAALLQKCEMKLNEKKMENGQRIQNESEKCQRIIRDNLKICTEKLKVLEVELENLRVEYQKQAKQNFREEKFSRDEKNKLELQLEGAIKKYDHVIGERMIEHLDLENQIKEEQKVMESFMILYRKEQAIYNSIVVKREEEEETKKLRIIQMYMMNRAARKIQKYWRKWRKALLKRQRHENTYFNTKTKKTKQTKKK